MSSVDAVEYYEALLETHFDSTREHLERAHRRYDMFYPDGRPWCTVLRPSIIDRATYERGCIAAAHVTRAVERATEHVLVDRKLRRSIGFPDYLERVLALDPQGNHSLLARLDGFVGEDGVARFVEYNAEPGGMASSREVELAFDAMPITHAFRGRYGFRTVDHVRCAVDALWLDAERAGSTAPPVVAVLKVSTNMVPSRMLRWLPWAAARGMPVYLVNADELELIDGRLRTAGTPIDILAIIDWDAIFQPQGAMTTVVAAIASGCVRTLNGVSRVVASTAKVMFELLSDPMHAAMFDAPTQVALREHVPWTRWIRPCMTDHGGTRVDLLPFVIEHRERLVIKPSNAQGGTGVVFGADTTPDAWKHLLRQATAHPYVVQDLVSVTPRRYPLVSDGALVTDELTVDFDPFVWNGDRAVGALVRAGSSKNLSTGSGSILPLWILET